MGFTRKAVILKESRGQHPNTTHTLINFKTMTDFNPNYNNAELLDQELTAAELSQVSGGLVRTDTFEFLHQAVKDLLFPSAL